ncbi:MAG: molecular chaperone HtpG, partial [Rhodospirillales bacterium]|nr:molecular chaperone HtpG [Rhodospirillales bacterium]
IRKALVTRVLSELKTRSKEAEDYAKFWENFGPILKEGVWEDSEHRTEIAGLLRFRSSTQEGWTSLADYVGRMQPDQDTIYYLAGDGVDALKTSPQLEGFRAKGLEVLLLTDPALAPPADARIRIVPDKQARTLLIADDGIGMSRQEMIDNLGTIARSGTRAFAQNLASAKPEDRPSLIGQFGVGFYSAFMVADRVEVTSRKAGSEEAFTWASDGAGQFTLAPATREAPGTDIVLHLKAEAEEYLEPMRLETVVRKWADHITVPITIAQDGTDQPANEGTALWRKSKSEVTEQNYAEFYRHLGHIFDSPWATLHWKAEGTFEYFCLLFIPGMKPFDPVDNDRESHVRLHVRRMFITDKAELLPPWLRFVAGVVDTEDLPLNVSREMLQTTPVL